MIKKIKVNIANKIKATIDESKSSYIQISKIIDMQLLQLRAIVSFHDYDYTINTLINLSQNLSIFSDIFKHDNPGTLKSNIALIIRKAMIKNVDLNTKRLKHADIAKKAGIATSQLSSILSNYDYNPRIDTIIKICVALDIVGEIFNLD